MKTSEHGELVIIKVCAVSPPITVSLRTAAIAQNSGLRNNAMMYASDSGSFVSSNTVAINVKVSRA